MFEILHSAMQRDQLRIVKDGFYTFTDKGEEVTSTAFFALTDDAVDKMVKQLRKKAGDRPLTISTHADAPEAQRLMMIGFGVHERKDNTVRWRFTCC